MKTVNVVRIKKIRAVIMMVNKPEKITWVIFLLLLSSGGFSGQADILESTAALRAKILLNGMEAAGMMWAGVSAARCMH